MNYSLVIVESPTKVATIQKILGPNFVVASTRGHFADLPEKKGAVDIEHGFAVQYRLTEKGAKTIADLRKQLGGASELIIATDADREGEMIGHLAVEFLQPTVPVKRVRFNAITADAINEAMANPTVIDERLVMAARSRRVLDHVYGFHLSPELWRTVRPGLAAGRVQSPALHMVVEREKERMAFVVSGYHGVDMTVAGDPAVTAALRTVDGVEVAASRHFDAAGKPKSGVLVLGAETATDLVSRLEGAAVSVVSVDPKAYRRRAPFPYITSSMLQDAAGRLKLGSKATQSALQSLFEAGHITYPRTDSPHMAPQAIAAARAVAIEMFGEQNVPERARHPKAKKSNAQEAHEALRPTNMSRRTVKGVGTNAQRIYEMIWRRTIASQMIDATGTTTTVSFAVQAAGAGEQCVFTASGTVIDVPGFRLVYVPQTEEEPPMPGFAVGQSCTADQFTAVAHSTKPPARYTEGTLIKALEEEGIGRPSTYTAIMQSLRLRYVWSKKGDAALIPTVSAFAVDQVMGICFAELIDHRFTSQMEDRLNDVVAGDLEYENLMSAFWSVGDGTWTPLEKLIVNGKTLFDPKKTPVLSFGVHPTLGEEVVLRAGRAYKSRGRTVGRPYLACGKKTVSIADETELDQLTPDVAFARLLENREPRVLGEHGGHPVEVLRGIYGPYVRWNGRNVKLPKTLDAGTVTLDEAVRLLE